MTQIQSFLIITLQAAGSGVPSHSDNATRAKYWQQELLALRLDELGQAQDSEANLLDHGVTLASSSLSGLPVAPVDNEEEERANAANAARRAEDSALISSALKKCDGFGDQKLQDFDHGIGPPDR